MVLQSKIYWLQWGECICCCSCCVFHWCLGCCCRVVSICFMIKDQCHSHICYHWQWSHTQSCFHCFTSCWNYFVAQNWSLYVIWILFCNWLYCVDTQFCYYWTSDWYSDYHCPSHFHFYGYTFRILSHLLEKFSIEVVYPMIVWSFLLKMIVSR